jgi:hypothetical protein
MKHIRFLTILVTLTVVVVCGYAALQWFRSHLDSGSIADQCERRIEKTIDPTMLQSWATHLLQQYPPGRTNFAGPFALPTGLANVWEQGKPSVYLREATNGEEEYVYVFWGSGVLGHWGLSVGSPTFVPKNPKSGTRMWKPGIYFWRDPH